MPASLATPETTPLQEPIGRQGARIPDASEEARPTLFTPGPVMLEDAACRDGARQMVYHRTTDFSRCVSRCEHLLRQACGAAAEDRVMMLTASGTAGMEAAVLNLFSPGDRVLVVNAGDFGQRFVDICELHGLGVTQIRLAPGRAAAWQDLAVHKAGGFVGMLVTHHETSTGALLDLDLVSRFCREQGLLLVVDAVGSFLADPISMSGSAIDALIFSSQKALALPPGLSFVVLSGRGQRQVRATPRRSYYLDLGRYLDDIPRGQTPFTPAIGIIRQLEGRLERVLARGAGTHIDIVRSLALDFRSKVRGLPFRILAERPSNAVTALEPIDGTPPGHYVSRLADDHAMFVCPNGGPLRDRVFRVGHLGALSPGDNTRLVHAIRGIVDHLLIQKFRENLNPAHT